MVVTVKDETFTGKILHELELEFQTEKVTVKAIIEARVKQEVNKYNQHLPDRFMGLVQPTEKEKMLNKVGLKSKKPPEIDAEKQIYVALEAFSKNGFFVLVDDKQCDSLNDEVFLNANSKISFLKLTPLVGG